MGSRFFGDIGILLLIGLLIIFRYINIGTDSIQILLFTIYYSLAIIAYAFSKMRFKNPINPISLFVPFLLLLSYSFIRLSEAQYVYSTNTFLIINISIFSYLVVASLKYEYNPVRILVLDNSLKKKFIYFISLMAMITFLIECAVFGYVPILNIMNADVYGDTNAKLVPFLHYFIIISAFIPSWSYILYKENILTKKVFRLLFISSVFILLNYLSKQLYLLFAMSFFLSYIYYNNFNKRVFIKSAAFLVLIFVAIIYLRFDSEGGSTFSEFYRAIAGIRNDKITLFEAFMVEYSSKRFSVLDDIVRFSDHIKYLGYGTYTFRPITSFLLLEKLGFIQRIPELDSEDRVGTFLIDPYLDFGFIGVFILNGLYGYLASRYYNQFREKYPEAIIKFGIIVFCILMGMFVNYFNTMLVWLGFIVNKFLIGGLKKRTII